MNNMIEYREGALPGDNVNDNTDNLLFLVKDGHTVLSFLSKNLLESLQVGLVIHGPNRTVCFQI